MRHDDRLPSSILLNIVYGWSSASYVCRICAKIVIKWVDSSYLWLFRCVFMLQKGRNDRKFSWNAKLIYNLYMYM